MALHKPFSPGHKLPMKPFKSPPDTHDPQLFLDISEDPVEPAAQLMRQKKEQAAFTVDMTLAESVPVNPVRGFWQRHGFEVTSYLLAVGIGALVVTGMDWITAVPPTAQTGLPAVLSPLFDQLNMLYAQGYIRSVADVG